MSASIQNSFIAQPDDCILVTGAAGFIGSRVVDALLKRGFRNLRLLTRPSSKMPRLEQVIRSYQDTSQVKIIAGNLLSAADCAAIAKDVKVVLHLAAGKGEKSFADAFMNSVITTRNLLDACVAEGVIRRFVNMSSFAVYRNMGNAKGRLLDETAPVDDHPELRHNSYCFAKAEQDRLVAEYGQRFKLPYVLVRPGVVYGPGNTGIHGRVGIGTFGIFMHMGGGNTLPLTYVDNCADAMVLAGLVKDIDGEVFNVVDDKLPTSRRFLTLYKRKVKRFNTIYVPHALAYSLCAVWEWYAKWSKGQLPPVYNRRMWHANWKRTRYSNAKVKSRLGWQPAVPTNEGLERYFEGCRAGEANA
jgi:nucleoside-diphosphate-sugar epimerase